MNSDASATSRFLNAMVLQYRLAERLEVMLDSRPALESATRSGLCPNRSTVTWSLAWSKFSQKSGQEGGRMVGQIVGQMVNKL